MEMSYLIALKLRNNILHHICYSISTISVIFLLLYYNLLILGAFGLRIISYFIAVCVFTVSIYRWGQRTTCLKKNECWIRKTYNQFSVAWWQTGFVLSMEYLEKYGIQLTDFKVMNSMKFRVAVWKSMDFGEFYGDFLGRG